MKFNNNYSHVVNAIKEDDESCRDAALRISKAITTWLAIHYTKRSEFYKNLAEVGTLQTLYNYKLFYKKVKDSL